MFVFKMFHQTSLKAVQLLHVILYNTVFMPHFKVILTCGIFKDNLEKNGCLSKLVLNKSDLDDNQLQIIWPKYHINQNIFTRALKSLKVFLSSEHQYGS